MKKILEFLKNNHVQGATVSGICIIVLALYFKRVEHIQVPILENAIPGYILTIYETVHKKIKSPFWSRILPWNVLMLAATAIIILRRLIW